MRFNHGIKRRVFTIFGGFTLFLTLAYTAMSLLVAYVVEDEILEKILAHEGKVIESEFHQHGKINQPRVDYMTLYLMPESAPSEIAASLKKNAKVKEIFSENQRHYHIQHLYLGEQYQPVLVAEVTPFLSVTNASPGILLLFAIVFSFTLSIALWFAYRITLRTTRPVTTLAQQVTAKKRDNRSVDLTRLHDDNEIGFLAKTIEEAFGELNAALKRESDFNRDVSHELRTPLTVINNTLAMSTNGQLDQQGIKLLTESTAQINQIVKTLLALARAETVHQENISLRSLVEDCILELHPKMVEQGFAIELEIDEQLSIITNRQLIVLLVNNLINNAMAYASAKQMVIRCKLSEPNALQLIFENSISQPIPDNVTQPTVKQANSEGLGHGLYLVQRITEALGGQFNIEPDDHYFRAVVFLA